MTIIVKTILGNSIIKLKETYALYSHVDSSSIESNVEKTV